MWPVGYSTHGTRKSRFQKLPSDCSNIPLPEHLLSTGRMEGAVECSYAAEVERLLQDPTRLGL